MAVDQGQQLVAAKQAYTAAQRGAIDEARAILRNNNLSVPQAKAMLQAALPAIDSGNLSVLDSLGSQINPVEPDPVGAPELGGGVEIEEPEEAANPEETEIGQPVEETEADSKEDGETETGSEEDESEYNQEESQGDNQEEDQGQPGQDARRKLSSQALKDQLGKKLSGVKQSLAKNLNRQAISAAAKGVWAFLLDNPIVLGIIIIIFVGILAFIIFALIAAKGDDGSQGTTFNRPAEPLSDREVIQKTLLSTGDPDVQKNLNNTVFIDNFRNNLITMKAEVESQEIKSKIDILIDKINAYSSNRNKSGGEEILKLLKEVLGLYEDMFPHIDGKLPIKSDQIINLNQDLHFGTPMKKDVPLDGKAHGTYIYYGEGKCDAVDIYTSEGAEVYPLATGEVIDLSDDGTGHKKIVIKHDNYTILYANFDPTVQKGDKITDLNKPIGKVAKIQDQSELHIEVAYLGVCLVTTPLDEAIKNSQSADLAWGQFLWDRIKKTFKL